MQRCTYCKAEQFDGAIFCSECGASLAQATSRRETTAALEANAAMLIQDDVITVDAPTVPVRSGAQTISFVVINSGRRMSLDLSDDLLIGRKDHARGIFPDIDLGLDGGYEAGVSRRHAIISCREGVCLVKDLDSANGTFVNDQRARANQLLTIQHGDELKLGTLILRIELG